MAVPISDAASVSVLTAASCDAAAAISGCRRLRGIVPTGAGASGAEAWTAADDRAAAVHGHRGDDDDAADDVLEERVDLHDAHDVVDDREDRHAADRAPDGAASTEQQCSAEHDRRDREQRVAALLPDGRAADAEAAGEQQTRETREHRAEHVRPDERHPGCARRRAGRSRDRRRRRRGGRRCGCG